MPILYKPEAQARAKVLPSLALRACKEKDIHIGVVCFIPVKLTRNDFAPYQYRNFKTRPRGPFSVWKKTTEIPVLAMN
jgi:hypothetical protein